MVLRLKPGASIFMTASERGHGQAAGLGLGIDELTGQLGIELGEGQPRLLLSDFSFGHVLESG
jgi:hypothetical protein